MRRATYRRPSAFRSWHVRLIARWAVTIAVPALIIGGSVAGITWAILAEMAARGA